VRHPLLLPLIIGGIILATLFAILLFVFGPGFSALFGGGGGAGGLFGGGADGGSGLLR
jgi:hypothetical protein